MPDYSADPTKLFQVDENLRASCVSDHARGFSILGTASGRYFDEDVGVKRHDEISPYPDQ